MYKLKGVGLREVNVLINYDLMSKDGSDREAKERWCYVQILRG